MDYQTLFGLLLFCSLVYRNIMTGKIHVFPFPNDLYLMCDLLLLLLLLLVAKLYGIIYLKLLLTV